MTSWLDEISVAEPCRVSWDGMRGDEIVRSCARCRKNVYDLSSLTQAEAEALVVRMEGKLCVRFRRRGDGTVVTRACPTTQPSLSLRLASGVLGLKLLGGVASADVSLPKAKGAPASTARRLPVMQPTEDDEPHEAVHVARSRAVKRFDFREEDIWMGVPAPESLWILGRSSAAQEKELACLAQELAGEGDELAGCASQAKHRWRLREGSER
jgi:hypothetical protein